MNDKISNASVATILVAAVILIIAIAGAVAMIADPDTLSFKDYIDALAIAGAGGGLLGIGRGILGGAKTPGGFRASPQDIATEQVLLASSAKPLGQPTTGGAVDIDPVDTGGTTLDPGPTGKRGGPTT